MKLINYKYELVIEYCLDMDDNFTKKILYKLLDNEYNSKHKFEEVKVLIRTYDINDIIKYLVNKNEL